MDLETPRPELPGADAAVGTPITINYSEGAEVGYRWFAGRGHEPLFAFGHGLSYTRFDYQNLIVVGDDTIRASPDVTSTGKVRGADVPHLYLTKAASARRVRLLGFERVELDPGQTHRVSIAADPSAASPL